MTTLTATYSPEDNKLRLYASERLDPETYAKAKELGFRWAPKQDLFVAPMWHPQREDFLIELCGEIGDENKSLVDRQEERAERFEGYQENRLKDAEAAHDAVSAITENIPLGQPILIGHHSEKKARKDAERIERGMQKAVNMWETSEYWKYRVGGVLRHAEYKEKPAVRARRIKKLQAEERKFKKTIKELTDAIALWNREGLTLKQALSLTSWPFVYSDALHGQLEKGEVSIEEAKTKSIKRKENTLKFYERWLKHTAFRIEYESDMLEGQGAIDLLKPKPRPKQLPLLNYRQPEGFQVENIYHRGEFSTYPQIEMTAAEYQKKYKDSRGTATVDGSHRVRVYYGSFKDGIYKSSRSVVFLTDKKEHQKPEEVNA